MAARALSFTLAYLRVNLAAAMEYRVAFLSQCLGMAVNNTIAFVFWWIYFDRFPAVGGWGLRDMLLLWGVVALGVGLAVAIFGNCHRLAALIAQGQLDYYLTLPRNPLLHTLVSRMGLASWGDVGFGLLAFLAAGDASPGSLALFLTLAALSMAIFIAFMTLIGSLSFFIGNAEVASNQAMGAITTFSLYPGSVFRDGIRLLLYTAIPAGLIGHVPVELLRRFDPLRLALLVGAAVVFWALALAVFAAGLRRYESGNLLAMRG